MPARLLRTAASVRWTIAYIVLCLALAVVTAAAPTRIRRDVVLHASTNLHNLWHGHLLTLLASAFVADGTSVVIVLLCGVVIAAGELAWGARRTVGVFLLGHVGATLIVAAGLSTGEALHWLPHSLIHVEDVGLSYGAMAVAGALSAAVPRRLRWPWISGWILIDVTAVAVGQDFTDWGHLTALLLGLTYAWSRGSNSRVTTAPTAKIAAPHQKTTT
jgi:hypothetical protein